MAWGGNPKLIMMWVSNGYFFEQVKNNAKSMRPYIYLCLDNITSQPWSDATCPRTTSSSALLLIVTLFSLKRQDKVLKEVVWGQVASDHHSWDVILPRPIRFGGDELCVEAIWGSILPFMGFLFHLVCTVAATVHWVSVLRHCDNVVTRETTYVIF